MEFNQAQAVLLLGHFLYSTPAMYCKIPMIYNYYYCIPVIIMITIINININIINIIYY